MKNRRNKKFTVSVLINASLCRNETLRLLDIVLKISLISGLIFFWYIGGQALFGAEQPDLTPGSDSIQKGPKRAVPDFLPTAGIKTLGGRLLLDRYVEITQGLQADKYIDLVGISTPTATVASNHSNLWLNNAQKALCTRFDDGTSGCLALGSAITGFLTTSLAASTYLTQSSATVTYLQTSSATATYVQISSANVNFLTQSSATVTYCRADGTNCPATTGVTAGSTTTWTGTNIFAGSTSIKGTTTNNEPATGYVGEYISSTSASNVNAALTGVFDDLVSISLTAGDWDVSLMAYCDRNSATWQAAWFFVGTTAGNNTTGSVVGQNSSYNGWVLSATTPNFVMVNIPAVRTSLSATTTVYLKRYFEYTLGTPRTAGARISARRMR